MDKTLKTALYYTWYDADKFHRSELTDLNAMTFEEKGVHWIDIVGYDDQELVYKIGDRFGIHHLAIEDALDPKEISKYVEYQNFMFVVVKNIYIDGKQEMSISPISFIMKKNLLLTIRPDDGIGFDRLLTRLEQGIRIRGKEVDDLMIAIIDGVVDNCYKVMDGIGDDLDDLEDEVLLEPDRETLENIYTIKKDIIQMRRIIYQNRAVLSDMSKSGRYLIDDDTLFYLRDVYDHVAQTLDILDSYREVTSSILDMYLSTQSNRTNDIMKTLTIMSTIAIPLTFLSSVYGMNFQHMPELAHEWGYPLFWLICVVVLLALLFYFRKKKWI